nr:MAG TPA: hypothetical protein [Caudoviricetes sp.]
MVNRKSSVSCSGWSIYRILRIQRHNADRERSFSK